MVLRKSQNENVETASFSLGPGWTAKAVTSHSLDFQLTRKFWETTLNCPDSLFENVEKTLKTENKNTVAVKNLYFDGKTINVVIKRHCPASSFRSFIRSLRSAKAFRNFNTAIRLSACNIPVAAPLAAIQKRNFFRSTQSIYITRFFEHGSNLFNFLTEQTNEKPSESFYLKKQLAIQIAHILAQLHNNGFWHRDSKAPNFIVYKKSDNYQVALIDMDGIKPYRLRRKVSRSRSLWTLAASLMPLSIINKTDYLRAFKTYCNLIGLDISEQKHLFRDIAENARKKHEQRIVARSASM
ncbi:MAG: lipopolysaccharide kinase InaA family protein [Planctomycetota bacterium]|jgi:serine/threonine protein kinase